MTYESGRWVRGTAGAAALCVVAGAAVGLVVWAVTGAAGWVAEGAVVGGLLAALAALASLVLFHPNHRREG